MNRCNSRKLRDVEHNPLSQGIVKDQGQSCTNLLVCQFYAFDGGTYGGFACFETLSQVRDFFSTDYSKHKTLLEVSFDIASRFQQVRICRKF